MEIEFEQDVLMSPYMRIDDIISGKTVPAVVQKGLHMSEHGYTLIGTCKVVATLQSKDELVQRQIKALQATLANERAQSQRRQNAIIDKISKLQALTFEAA